MKATKMEQEQTDALAEQVRVVSDAMERMQERGTLVRHPETCSYSVTDDALDRFIMEVGDLMAQARRVAHLVEPQSSEEAACERILTMRIARN